MIWSNKFLYEEFIEYLTINKPDTNMLLDLDAPETMLAEDVTLNAILKQSIKNLPSIITMKTDGNGEIASSGKGEAKPIV